MPELESMIEQKLIDQLIYGGVTVDIQGGFEKQRQIYGRISDISLNRITKTG